MTEDTKKKPTGTRPHRERRFIVWTLIVLATVIGTIAVLAVWVNRQALNTDNWKTTSAKLIENKQIEAALSNYLVDQLYANVDVSAELQKVLPPRLAPLAGPAAAGLQQVAGKVADRVLANPKAQQLWVDANGVAHKQLLVILSGGTKTVSTTNGEVVLNVKPLVNQLASGLGIQKQVNAARSKLNSAQGQQAKQLAAAKLGVKLPQNTGHIVILKSDQLATAQDVAQAIKSLALWLTVLALLLYAGAVALARGWRREALRAVSVGFLAIGLLVLIARRAIGDQVVDNLVASASIKPAAQAAWTIGTSLLYNIGVAMVAYGIVLLVCAWIAGPTRPATALRRVLAPSLRERVLVVYGVAAVVVLLVILWGPTPAFRKVLPVLLMIGLLVLGIELLRRQAAREFPDAQAGDTWRGIRASRDRRRASHAAEAAPAAPATGEEARLGQLERLASLHSSGALTDEEFAAQKRGLLGAT